MADTPEDVGLDSKAQTERDRIDLNHEQAGDDTGRIKRFLVEGASGYAADTEEKKARREYRSLLDMLLMEDPHYAALYSRVADKLDRAQSAVDKAMIDIDRRLETSGQALQRMRENAGELEDGTKVFRSDKDGHIYTEDGQRLSDEQARNVDIPDGAASLEDYRRQKEERDLALRQREEIERYQREVLDPSKDRMNDPNNPPTKEELKGIERHIEDEMPEAARDDYRSDIAVEAYDGASMSAAHEMVDETSLNVPDMATAFDQARTDIPDFGPVPEIEPDPSLGARTPG